MRCNDNRDWIDSLAADELSPLRAWRLRRHLRHCPDCNTYWERSQGLLSGLRALGEAVPSDALRERIFATLPFPAPTSAVGSVQPHAKEIRKMKQMRYALASLALALVITGTIAAQVALQHQNSAALGDSYGRIWHLSGNFRGDARIVDPHGKLLGMYGNEGGISAQAELNIGVGKERFRVHGLGKHELITRQGILLGYVLMSTPTQQETLTRNGWKREPRNVVEALLWSEREPKTGVSGLDAFPWGLDGFDKHLGIVWKLRGGGKARALDPVDHHMMSSGETKRPVPQEILKDLPPDLLQDVRRKEPKITWTVGGYSGTESGYGTHKLVDAHGKTVLILEVSE